MKKRKLDVKIVCDRIGCGGLSTYRLTFDSGEPIFLCKNCYDEMKEFFLNEENGKRDDAKK